MFWCMQFNIETQPVQHRIVWFYYGVSLSHWMKTVRLLITKQCSFFYNAYIYLHAILTTSSFITMSLTQLYTGVLYIFTITQYQVSVLRKINCIFKQELWHSICCFCHDLNCLKLTISRSYVWSFTVIYCCYHH